MRAGAGAIPGLLLVTLALGPCQSPRTHPSQTAPASFDHGFSRWQGQQLDELARLNEFSGIVLLAEGGRVLVRHAVGSASRRSRCIGSRLLHHGYRPSLADGNCTAEAGHVTPDGTKALSYKRMWPASELR